MEVLSVANVSKKYRVPGGQFYAVSDVSFSVQRQETFALVGESGCGKSTTGRAVMNLPGPDEGSIRILGDDLSAKSKRERAATVQMIFQDARSSLNPRRRVRDVVAEGLQIAGVHRDEIRIRVDATLDSVGLDPDQVGDRRPHEFSGGQCQRIAIARAMIMRPSVLICDEPVASLDVSVQAQVINLLADMKAAHGLSMLFISHDLGVVEHISDRIAVMYLGKIVETGETDQVFNRPRHPYTRALLDSVPVPDPDRPSHGQALKGEIPSPMNPPSGCRFRTRCPLARELCARVAPPMLGMGDGQETACHFALDVPA